ncbi:hypothetical protein [Pseudochryseolinea flava]|uniref:Uncharacterized protein n=1 Tax=Pseudochryseolinea flava TaxID=2059302 RepID=A0A364XY85_9BACT|nr:hypothetical protein [Pseudochryseolinea flava]RAV98530.1 hypothetical protein DQQ10_23725 [Pseudochryseolinea flava]
MNTMNIFFLIVSSAFNARQQTKPDEVTRIEFTSITRGYQEHLILDNDSVVFSYTSGTDRQVKRNAKANHRQAWKKTLQAVSNIDWTSFDSLKSPTNKRAFDGAKHSSIVITTRTAGTHNHTFDDENPNETLGKLMRCIQEQKKTMQ